MKNMLLRAAAAAVLIAGAGSAPAGGQPLQIVSEQLAPYNYRQNGEVKGVSTDVVNAVLRELDLTAEIQLYPWVRAYRTALNQPNVLIYSIARTAQREELFHWVGELAALDVYLFRLAERRDLALAALDDARPYVIGTWRDDVAEQYLLGQGFAPGRQLDNSGSPRQNIRKLVRKRLDLIAISELALRFEAARLGYDPALFAKALKLESISRPLYMAFSRQTSPQLVDRFREALRAIKRNGVYDAIQAAYR